ncbi:uncharacterized protein LOC108890930 isoform X1 [Lates calcarifer]|uniref:Uncharacterized protein LOC108875463 isoform X1 n=1 Tax=Lates calcarifer TaxID=8187 RepID=A0AAJ7Q0K0_LATCA|nr:uncharacterized protein LOC108875463 isoform X1 [Lates calcarifer]XP_018543525.2 uncharacterized protein LOC108890930 isoform X1 [Lates calcarifer]
MNIRHALFFCCCLSALCDGLVNTQRMFMKTEGQNVVYFFRVKNAADSRKYFCRNDCEKEDILIETHANRAQSGRYTIRYNGFLHVIIKELTKSDTGRYRFGASNSSSLGSYQDFEVEVRALCEGDVLYGERKVYSSAEGGNVTIRCSLSANTQNRKFLCREECKKTLIETTTVGAKSGRYSIEYESSSFFNVTIAELNKSDSGLYRCGVASQVSKNTCQGFEISVTSGYSLPLVVCLIVLFFLAISLLLLYKLKIRSSTSLDSGETSTGRNMESVLHYNSAPVSTLEDPAYDTVNPPSPYETLNVHHTACDQMYTALSQQT